MGRTTRREVAKHPASSLKMKRGAVHVSRKIFAAQGNVNVEIATIFQSLLHLVCHCGETKAYKKDTGIRIDSCRDAEKKSKCRCLGSYRGCSDLFQCFNCENVHGTRLAAQFKSPKGVKKKRSDTGSKRQRSCDFLGS